MTPSNIMSGFRKCRIFPFDRGVFTDDDFLCSYVTDRTLGEGNIPSPANHVAEKKNIPSPVHSMSQPQTSSHQDQITASNATWDAGQSPSFIGPESFRGFPKVQKRKEVKRGRKRGKSCVATDLPVEKATREKSLQRGKKKPKKVSKKLFDNDSENEDVTVPLASSDDEDCMPEVEDESTNWTDKAIPTKGDYVLSQIWSWPWKLWHLLSNNGFLVLMFILVCLISFLPYITSFLFLVSNYVIK